MNSNLTDVSIIIVTYKGDDLTKHCLDSLVETCGTAPQIVLVDNSPSAKTRQIASAYRNVRYVSSPDNAGFAGGNNRAIPFCTRRYILFLNNDTIIQTKESIEQLVTFLDNHPNCAAAQGSGVLSDKVRMAGCGSFLTPFGFLDTDGFAKADDPCHNVSHKCFAVGGFFMMIRKSILPAIGRRPFRSHFWCYYEEVDLCHRIWLAGFEVWYVRTSPIIHISTATSGQFPRSAIMSQYLRNLLFSLSVNLSFIGRVLILTPFKLSLFGHAILHLLKGNKDVFIYELKVLQGNRWNRLRVCAARRQVMRMRKVSDWCLFKTIIKCPTFSSLVLYIKGKI